MNTDLQAIEGRQSSLALALREAGLCGLCSRGTAISWFSATIRTHLCSDCQHLGPLVTEVIQRRNEIRKQMAAVRQAAREGNQDG